jgi:hypothetical protein
MILFLIQELNMSGKALNLFSVLLSKINHVISMQSLHAGLS